MNVADGNQRGFACNICGSHDISRLEHRSDGVPVIFCATCGMGVIHPIPSDLSHFYTGDYYAAGEASRDGYADYETMAEHGVSWAAALVDAIGIAGDVLDIGCADGYLLGRLGLPMRRSGIEANEKAAGKARKAGVEVISNDLFNDEVLAGHAGRFDVVTSIATFEHLRDFKRGVSAALSLLNANGYLLFEVPLMSEFNDNSIWLSSSLEHVYYPSALAIERLFADELGVPLLGSEFEIQNYASTYVGLAARDLSSFVATWEEVVSGKREAITPQSRRAKALLRLIHGGRRSPADIALLTQLRRDDVGLPLLRRIEALWTADAARLEASVAGERMKGLHESVSAPPAFAEPFPSSDSTDDLARAARKLAMRGILIGQLRASLLDMKTKMLASAEREAALEKRNHRTSVLLRKAGSELTAASKELERAAEDRRFISSLEEARDWHAIQAARWKRLLEETLKKSGSGPRTFLRQATKAMAHPITSAGKVAQKTRRWLMQHRPRAGGAHDRADAVEIEVDAYPAGLPLVSVVIPCFNYGAFVTDAVESAASQTFRRIEVLVVEGGSTDGVTPAIVAGLERPGVRTFLREGRHRAGSNRNFGIERARGKYICCLDADDLIDPTYIEKAAYLLENFGYDVVSPAVKVFGATSSRYGVARKIELGSIIKKNEVTTCATFRRTLWEKAGGYRDFGDGSAATHIHEDWELWVRFAAAGAKFHNMHSDHLFMYRVHNEGSLSTRQDVRPRDEHGQAIRELNASLITPEAIERSRRTRKTNFLAKNGLVNLVSPASAQGLQRRSILVALPWMVLGGAERLLSKVIGHLVTEGWSITIVTTDRPNEEDGDTSDWFKASTPHIFQLPRFLERDRWSGFLDYLIVSRHVSHLLIAGSAFTYEQLPRLRQEFPNLSTYDLLFNTSGHTEKNRRFADEIDLNIVENGEVRAWLLDNGEREDRIVTIPSGIEMPRTAQRSGLRARLGIPEDSLLVGFSGRWSPEKNPLGFLWVAELLAINPRISFVMTGTGRMEADLREALRDSTLPAGRFHLLGNVDDLSKILPEFDLLVVPSRQDGRPVVVLEAMASGVPVVASRVGGLPELIVPGETGELCDPDDLVEFADAIERLERNRQTLFKYKQAAQRFAQQNFDEQRMLRTYHEVMRAGRPNRSQMRPTASPEEQ